MDEDAFRIFLRRGGRSENAARSITALTRAFETYLTKNRSGKTLQQASPADLEAFVDWVKSTGKTAPKKYLWGIRYYYEYIDNKDMCALAGQLRERRIKRKPFRLDGFRGINPGQTEKLAAAGIVDIEQMLEAGRSPAQRQALAEKTAVPEAVILELVKLSDLARIPGLKRVRARLYYDAGVDSVDALAQWDPEDLRALLSDFVRRTGFDGIPPTPKETKNAVEQARHLPRIVEF
jgi:hypothetical protein